MDYSYIRENFDIKSISKCILSIQVSLDGFSFVICPSDNKNHPDYIFIKRLSGESQSLTDALKSFTGFDLLEFYAIRIIFHESTFALVPDTLFDLKDMKTFLSLNHASLDNRKALSNSIPAIKAECVFSMDELLYKLLKKKFPGADFCHSSLPFCSMAINKSQDGCFIQVYEKSIELAVIKEKQLLLYNIFDLQDTMDVLYFVLNAYKTTGLSTLIHPIYIAGVLQKNAETTALLSKYLKDIRYYSSDFVTISEKGEFEYPSHYFLNHREILNCEL